MRHIKRRSGRRKKRRDERHALAEERDERCARVTAKFGDKAYWACGKKYAYPSKGVALSCAAKRVGRGAGFLRVYKCPYCGMWHLTSSHL